jgi:putative heme-binding domain-containing protein
MTLHLWVLGLVAAGLFGRPGGVRGEPAGGVQWIWTNEGNPRIEAPAGQRYFRRVFTINRRLAKPVEDAVLDITADDAFRAWVNGVEVGHGARWEHLFHFDVTNHLIGGANVIAVEARNEGGPAGLVVRLSYIPKGQTREVVVSDAQWKTARKSENGWQRLKFDDSQRQPAKALGRYGQTEPWKTAATSMPNADRFTVPPGFRVEEAVKPPAGDKVFSLVNMTFDARGRLLVSREDGPTLLCTDANKDGIFQTVRPYCTLVKNSQGMCWVDDALLLVGDGPEGTGLYRCRDTRGEDRIDKVELLHKIKGEMGDHGPHAILHGPDGWLYLVLGNHAWAQPDKLADNSPLRRWPTGGPGPDQGRPDTKEDVLLPRLNDPSGHAANILAPGGTIWRLDKNGRNMSLVNAGLRNAFDAAFSPNGELFTFDSDMELDVDLPWYRPVRVVHCIPGGEYGWRTGASKIPAYALDTLPPLSDTGRGSPVGMTFYDHEVFPERYRGACFLADWSIGAIWVLQPERTGATYKGTAEKFCTGAPLNVTDLEVGPDGAIYFTMGGRNTQGGIYRIRYADGNERKTPKDGMRRVPQPLAAWSAGRAALPDKLEGLLASQRADDRALAVWSIGVRGLKDRAASLVRALKDEDSLVRRRACEACIRAGIEPPLDEVWPLLHDSDRFLRTAARLVIQRIDAKKWVERIGTDEDLPAWEGIVALCKEDKATPYTGLILSRLEKTPPAGGQRLLDFLRIVELAAIHTGASPRQLKTVAAHCLAMFPHKETFANRELAVLLTHFHNIKALHAEVPVKLAAALQASAGDRPQQIHYFYCLRLLKDGWTPAVRSDIAAWYASTQDWTGGASFAPYLENIFREVLDGFTLAEKRALLAAADKRPFPALVLAQRLQNEPDQHVLPDLYALAARLEGTAQLARKEELRQAVNLALARTALAHPAAANLSYLVQGLHVPSKLVVEDVMEALKKNPARPKADDAASYRAVLLAAGRLEESRRWKAVEVLRHWSQGRQFGAADGDARKELSAWAKWFSQAFPREPALPDAAGDKASVSRYRFEELASFLEGEGKNGDPTRGRLIFEKAQCLKCHKYGKEGEGIGPDLTTLSKRFKRHDVLESIYYPSKVISDQYRSTMILTKKGAQVVGLAAPQGDRVTVLQSDGTKLTLKKDDIERQVASLISVMPEKLLDPLTRREIADLFAFLESEPVK